MPLLRVLPFINYLYVVIAEEMQLTSNYVEGSEKDQRLRGFSNEEELIYL